MILKYEDKDYNCREIQSFKGYFVSDCGSVFRVKGQTPHLMKPARDKDGYLSIYIRLDGGKRKTLKVHRLVAKAFIPNPNSYRIVRHLNHIRDDNDVSNVAWGTAKMNSQDSLKEGRLSKLSQADFEKAVDLLYEGNALTVIRSKVGSSCIDMTLKNEINPQLQHPSKTREEIAYFVTSKEYKKLGLQKGIWPVAKRSPLAGKKPDFETLTSKLISEVERLLSGNSCQDAGNVRKILKDPDLYPEVQHPTYSRQFISFFYTNQMYRLVRRRNHSQLWKSICEKEPFLLYQDLKIVRLKDYPNYGCCKNGNLYNVSKEPRMITPFVNKGERVRIFRMTDCLGNRKAKSENWLKSEYVKIQSLEK